ncbi:DUF2359 domain-containing protein [Salix suchowensis]|nr:DUF2359 domain-containing protein [Salix suchowensis]
MDENSALIAQLLMEDEIEMRNRNGEGNVVVTSTLTSDGGWKTVTYLKRNKKQQLPNVSNLPENSSSDHRRSNGGEANVFRSIEQHLEDRRRRIEEESRRREEESGERDGSKRHSDEDDGESDDGDRGGAGEQVKKVKKPKAKKPKVTVAEAAAKIDAGDLGAFLVDITVSYETRQDILLMRFADYIGRAFSPVSAAQFPWLKIFKESSVAKLVDIPLAHISQDVYKTAVDWLGQRSLEALASFVLWSMDSIFDDLASHQGITKGSKKVVQQSPSKSLVAIFVVLAMALQRNENPKYQGQDKLPVTVWMIAQASQGDLVVGLYMWIRVLFPMLSGKSSNNPQSRDLILQLVERILSSPKARTILLNGAVKKGERVRLLSLVLWKQSNEASYAADIEHFVKATGEGNSELSKEASEIFIWCLTKNPECYKQWDMFYLDNLEASVKVLRKLSDEWKDHSVKHSSLDLVRETLKSFRQKNEKASAKAGNAGDHASLKEADKHCKAILGQFSRGRGCVRSLFIVSAALAVGAVIVSQKEYWDLQKLSAMLNLPSL